MGVCSRNPDCRRVARNLGQQSWARRNPDSVRNTRIRKLYGITLVEFDALLSLQGGKCAICGTAEPGGRGDWHIDHHHSTGRVRGLLCHSCNVAIGSLRDSPAIIRAAAAYVEAHQ